MGELVGIFTVGWARLLGVVSVFCPLPGARLVFSTVPGPPLSPKNQHPSV